MIGLGLVVVGAVAVQIDVPVKPGVVGLGVAPGDRAGRIAHIRGIDRRALIQRALRRGQHRAAVELAHVVIIILIEAAELDLVAIGRAHRELHQARGNVVAGVADLGASTILVVTLGAIDRAAEHIDRGIDAHAAEDRPKPARVVGAVRAGHIDAPALAGTHHVIDVLGAERHHAADRARAKDVGARAAHHIDAADQFRIQEERTLGMMAGALIVLARAIDHHGDPAKILQTANVNRAGGIIAAVLERHAGHGGEHVLQALGLNALDLFQGDDADRRQRVDRLLFALAGDNGDGIERLLARLADLRVSALEPAVRRGLLRLRVSRLQLLLLLGRLRRRGRTLRMTLRCRERNHRNGKDQRSRAIVQHQHDSPGCSEF